MQIAKSYASALKISACIQVGILIACSQILKSYIVTVYTVSFAIYWAVALALMLVNPRVPRRWQLLLVAVGFALVYPAVWLYYRNVSDAAV